MAHALFSAPLTGLSGASADETKSTPIPLNTASQVGGTVTWSAGVSAGQVVFEIASTPDYAGAWHVIYTGDFIDGGADSFSYPGPFSGFGRWRINMAVVGGTVSTDAQALTG